MADQPLPGTTQNRPNQAEKKSVPGDVSSAKEPAALASVAVTLPQLIQEFAGPLYRYAFRLAGQASDAEDLVQQTFLVAQQKLHQLREADRASAWLYAVLRSCFLKSRRKPIPQTMDENFPLEAVASPDDNEANGKNEDAWLDRETLQLALSELPDEFKIVVLMFYFEDLSYKDIATQLEIPIGTVMSRLSRGKAQLRRRLEPEIEVTPEPVRPSKFS